MQLHAQISELQSLAVKDETSIVELLRQALIVSAKVKDGDFKAWIESEMKGYGDKTRSEIPQYRHLAADMKTFNPVNGVLMPMHFQDASLARDLSVIQAKNGIAEIEQFSKETGGKCYVEFPPEFIAQFNAQSDLHAQFPTTEQVRFG